MIRSEGLFLACILVASAALGVGVPATFGLTVDLIPVGDRGLAAALITAGAYFPAAVFSGVWTIETLCPFLRFRAATGITIITRGQEQATNASLLTPAHRCALRQAAISRISLSKL